MATSVYIHIPFCDTICTYCAFTKLFYEEKIVNEYLKTLKKEIKKEYQGEEIKTIYIGGGTPSCLKFSQLKELLDSLQVIKKSSNIEFTIEVNPESITKEKLELLKQYGVNRISMGVESTHSNTLKYLGRHHDFSMVKEKIDLIKKIGFTNINVDLIYGTFHQTIKELEEDLKGLMELQIPHISTYSLMIEPHTILFINKEKNIEEELDFEMYSFLSNFLKKNGYVHYEISNFAKEGYESRHNLVYWNNDEYYGFGLGASGYLHKIRYTNTRIMEKYLTSFFRIEEKLTEKDLLSYALILGFRKIEGIHKKEFFETYKRDIHSLYNINELLSKGYLEENEDYIYIKYDKIYIQNSILINFVGE